ncbi:hypothetical protein CEXT_302931 [Caerostris extrusa]|uniref:Uncharacterized protein n=1 Tax=Caerostris extrusa TaxID=172846 RepID=A0AAV4V3Q3_CAEEX|nr:hypothetical protein CEXT_302931 [Caerostris extrusa]
MSKVRTSTPSDDEHRKQSRGTEQAIREDGQLPPGRRLSPGTIQLPLALRGLLQNTCCFLCVFRLTSSLRYGIEQSNEFSHFGTFERIFSLRAHLEERK